MTHHYDKDGRPFMIDEIPSDDEINNKLAEWMGGRISSSGFFVPEVKENRDPVQRLFTESLDAMALVEAKLVEEGKGDIYVGAIIKVWKGKDPFPELFELVTLPAHVRARAAYKIIMQGKGSQ